MIIDIVSRESDSLEEWQMYAKGFSGRGGGVVWVWVGICGCVSVWVWVWCEYGVFMCESVELLCVGVIDCGFVDVGVNLSVGEFGYGWVWV